MIVEKNDAKLGLFVLGAIALFVSFLFFKNAQQIVEKSYWLKVRLENIEGIDVGSDVMLQGYRVGRVERVDLRSEGPSYFFVAKVSVREDIHLWEGTRAVVSPKGLGSSFLDLRLPELEARRARLQAGDQIPGDLGVSLNSVLAKADHLLTNVDTSVQQIRDRIRERGLGDLINQDSVRKILKSLDDTLAAYRALAQDSRGLIGKADGAVGTLDQTLASVKASADQVHGLLERRSPDIDQTLKSLAATLQQMEVLTTQAKEMLHQDGPELDASLKSLHRSLDSVQELLELLKQKPSRVVWGTPSDKDRDKAKKAVEPKPAPARP